MDLVSPYAIVGGPKIAEEFAFHVTHSLSNDCSLSFTYIYLASHAKQIYFINVNNVPGICIKELGNSSYDEIIIYISLFFSLSLFHANSMVTKTINSFVSTEMNCHLPSNEGLRTLHKKYILISIKLKNYCFANLQSIKNTFSYFFI